MGNSRIREALGTLPVDAHPVPTQTSMGLWRGVGRRGEACLTAPFESHHALHDALALLRYRFFFFGPIGAVFAQLARLATDLYCYQLVDFLSAGFADCHARDRSSTSASTRNFDATSDGAGAGPRGCDQRRAGMRTSGCAMFELGTRASSALAR